MSLLFGLSLTLGLLLMTVILLYIFDYTKELPIALVGIMIFGDILLVTAWYQIGLEFVENISKFKMGICLSFMLMSFSRALIFFVNGKKRGWL